MILKAFVCIFAALLFFGLPGAFPQEALPTPPSKEAKSAEKPVMLGDRVLFHLVTEAEGFIQAKRASDVTKRIKKIAESARFPAGSIKTDDFSAPMTFIVAGDCMSSDPLGQV